MSRSELYDILHLIGAEQKDGQYFIEFTPDDIPSLVATSSLPVSDDEIWELPDLSAVTVKFNRGKRATRAKSIIDSDDDDDSKPLAELPDFSPAIVVPGMPTLPTFRILDQPESENITQPDTTVSTSASKNPEPATQSQLGPLNPSVIYSAINAVIASNHLPALPNPLPFPSTSNILNGTQVANSEIGPPALTLSQLELDAPVTGEAINSDSLKANSKHKGSKLKRKVAEKQDSEAELPKPKKPRVTSKPPPAQAQAVRSSSRFVIVEF